MFDGAESLFQVMDAEWQGIVQQSPAADTNVAAWNAEMERLCREHDALARSGRWVIGSDDLLSVIGRARYEVYHSAVIAWLLNPLGKHGLGTALLEALLGECGIGAVPDLHLARPEVEVQRGDTRADIVVFAPGMTLVIENKVDAGEQDRQCDRLHEKFEAEPGAVFVFITPTGRAPSTATGERSNHWTNLSYRRLAELLERALDDSAAKGAATTGRATAQGYLVTLRREFV